MACSRRRGLGLPPPLSTRERHVGDYLGPPVAERYRRHGIDLRQVHRKIKTRSTLTLKQSMLTRRAHSLLTLFLQRPPIPFLRRHIVSLRPSMSRHTDPIALADAIASLKLPSGPEHPELQQRSAPEPLRDPHGTLLKVCNLKEATFAYVRRTLRM